MATKRKAAVQDATPLVPQTTDLTRAGALCRIKGERGTYKVIEHARTEKGAEWYLLFGGSAGHESFRHVAPTRVVFK